MLPSEKKWRTDPCWRISFSFTCQASLLAAMQQQQLPSDTQPPVTSAQHPPHQRSTTVQCLWPRTIKGLRLPPFDMHSQGSVAAGQQGRGGVGDASSRGSSMADNQLGTLIFEVRGCG